MGVNSGSRDRNVLRIAPLEGSQVLTEGITTITTITMITTGTEGDEGDIWGFGVGVGSGGKGILALVTVRLLPIYNISYLYHKPALSS